MAIIRQDYGQMTDVITQQLIAPVLGAMVADRNFTIGDQFIVNNTLYKITAATVASGTDLVVGTNCAVSDTITQQMKDTVMASITATSSMTYAEALGSLGVNLVGEEIDKHLSSLKLNANGYIFDLAARGNSLTFIYHSVSSSYYNSICMVVPIGGGSGVYRSTRNGSTPPDDNSTSTIAATYQGEWKIIY